MTEGGRDAEGKDGSTVDGGERERKKESERRSMERGIRQTLSTSNRAGSKSPKDSNTSTRWVNQNERARECAVDDTHLGLFHSFHCEPFTTFTFAEGRKQNREDSLFLDLRRKRVS